MRASLPRLRLGPRARFSRISGYTQTGAPVENPQAHPKELSGRAGEGRAGERASGRAGEGARGEGANRTRMPLLFRRAAYNLRGGFLVRPLTIALALGCAGAVLSWMEEMSPEVSAWMPTTIFPSRADPQVAQIILAGIAGSIMTVVSIVFAILLMTLTLASMQFSPRIIVSFVQDRVTQWTLGMFLGTFLYCMGALVAASVRAGGHGVPGDPASDCVRGVAAVFHPSRFAGDQRESYCGPDRVGDGGDHRRHDAVAAAEQSAGVGRAAGITWEAPVASAASGYVRIIEQRGRRRTARGVRHGARARCSRTWSLGFCRLWTSR